MSYASRVPFHTEPAAPESDTSAKSKRYPPSLLRLMYASARAGVKIETETRKSRVARGMASLDGRGSMARAREPVKRAQSL